MIELVLLGLAGAAAGAINGVAGGGSLISYPALLASGLAPVAANVTNLVALLPGYLGGSVAYRAELRGQGGRARALGLTSAAGAAAGTGLLLLGSDAVFEAIVPGLVLLACALLAARPWLQRARGRRAGPAVLHAGVGLGAVYGGYFGAGLGIMLLAVLGALLDEDLQRLNALKGLLSLMIAAVSAVAVALFGPVAWAPAAAVAVGATLGANVGVAVARRVPAEPLRWSIVAYGVVLAVALALS